MNQVNWEKKMPTANNNRLMSGWMWEGTSNNKNNCKNSCQAKCSVKNIEGRKFRLNLALIDEGVELNFHFDMNDKHFLIFFFAMTRRDSSMSFYSRKSIRIFTQKSMKRTWSNGRVWMLIWHTKNTIDWVECTFVSPLHFQQSSFANGETLKWTKIQVRSSWKMSKWMLAKILISRCVQKQMALALLIAHSFCEMQRKSEDADANKYNNKFVIIFFCFFLFIFFRAVVKWWCNAWDKILQLHMKYVILPVSKIELWTWITNNGPRDIIMKRILWCERSNTQAHVYRWRTWPNT